MLQDIVLRIVLSELAKTGDLRVPVNSSNRHIHLSQIDADALFGAGYAFDNIKNLIQPGQFACREQVTMVTDAGSLTLRVVGPIRKETQIELSLSEAVKLKIPSVIRLSGNIEGTPGCTLKNGDRQARLDRGIIVAARHLHMSPDEAAAYGLVQGDTVALEVSGRRAAILRNVIVRTGQAHVLEAHIDREEANAAGLADGQLCRIIKQDIAPASHGPSPVVPQKGKGLLGEDEVLAAAHRGLKTLRVGKNVIITPLARDAAWEKGIELVSE